MAKKKISRRESMQKEIIFSQPTDSRTGFLSNESKHGFVIEDKRWPSVEHYLQAKKFDGTQYVEEIREAPTVYQAKKLAAGRMTFSVTPDGKVNKSKVYGKENNSVHIRDDWVNVEPMILEEAIRAKFFQNRRLQKRLLETNDAKLIDKNNPFTGGILERIREELMQLKYPINPVGASNKMNSGTPKDLKSSSLSADEKKFVRSVITLSLRIAAVEGWDRVYGEMIEDAVYNLVPNKKQSKTIINYINSIYQIPWTVVYRDLPNTEKLINEVQGIFKKIDDTQEYQVGPSAMIAAFVRWIRLEATSSQRDEIIEKAKSAKTMKIIIPKIKRWYREDAPPKFSGKSKKPSGKSNPSSHIKKSRKSPVKEKPLTSSEKEMIKSIIYENRDNLHNITLNDLRVILKDNLGVDSTSIMKKKDIRDYVISVLRDLSPDKKSKSSKKKTTDTSHAEESSSKKKEKRKTSSPPKKKKTPKKKKKSTPSPKKKKVPKTKTPKKVEDIPDNLIIVDLPKGAFFVWGKPLNRYAAKLLASGGKYAKSSSSFKDENVIQFKGKILEENKKKIVEYGGKYPVKNTKSGRQENTNIMEIKGKQLEKHREALEDLGGKYPKRSSSKDDHTKIKFDEWSRGKVEDIIFDSLSETEKYNTSYRKWLMEKLSDYIDTSVQVAYLVGKKDIDEDILDIVIRKIYGCNLQIEHNSPLEFDYTDLINSILTKRKEYFPYKFTPEAKQKLSRYIETIGSMLISSLPDKNYSSLQKSLQDYGNQIDKFGECPQIDPFTRNEVCLIRALRHISVCFRKYLNYPLGLELCTRAFLTLVPSEWRLGSEQYLSIILQEYKDWMAEDEIQRYLSSNDIKYKLSDIYSVIDYYDIHSSSEKFCSIKLNEGSNTSCEECMIVFAAALTYVTPNLGRPESSRLLRRMKILGTNSSPQIDTIPVSPLPQKEVLLDIPEQGSVVEVDSSLTEFQYADVIAVIVNSTEEKSSSAKKNKIQTTDDPVTDSVFKSYPYANVYSTKHKPYDLGSVILQRPVSGADKALLESTSDHRIVACLVAHFNPGGPKKILDTIESREKWFEDAVRNLFEMKEIKGKSIAFSGEQIPPNYIEIIEKYASKSKSIVYILTGETKYHSPTEKVKLAKSKRTKKGGTPVKDIPLHEIDDDDEGIPDEIIRAALYYKLLKPLKMTSANYSIVVSKLDSLSYKERNDILSSWEKESLEQRSKSVDKYINE